MIKITASVEQILLFDEYFGMENSIDGETNNFVLVPIEREMVRKWIRPELPEGWCFIDGNNLIYKNEGNHITKKYNFPKKRLASNFIRKLLLIAQEQNFYPQIIFSGYEVVITFVNIKYNFVCDKCIEMSKCTEMVAKNFYI